jgi:protein TonB
VSETARPYNIDLIELPDDGATAQGISEAPLPTRHEVAPPPRPDAYDAPGAGDADMDPAGAPDSALVALEARNAVLEFSEQMPEIEGGVGAYYLNIRYPKAAIEAGVHGRLILSFVVERDGRPSQIEVLQSLHPLCDSSAVRALRQTRFVPGHQNGEPVRVRMRLPVHFKIVTPTADSRAEADARRSG